MLRKMIGIHAIEDDDKTLIDVLSVFRDVLNSAELCCVILSYTADKNKLAPEVVSDTATRIKGMSILSFEELVSLTCGEDDPHRCLFAFFSSKQKAELFRHGSLDSIDLIAECHDQGCWMVLAKNESMIQTVKMHFAEPSILTNEEKSFIQSLIQRAVLNKRDY